MGTLRYKVVKRRNPMTAAVSYGPRLLRYTLIKADDVVERAAQNSNIDRGLLEAAMVGFQEARAQLHHERPQPAALSAGLVLREPALHRGGRHARGRFGAANQGGPPVVSLLAHAQRL